MILLVSTHATPIQNVVTISAFLCGAFLIMRIKHEPKSREARRLLIAAIVSAVVGAVALLPAGL